MSSIKSGTAVVLWSFIVIVMFVLFQYANIPAPVEIDLPLRDSLHWDWIAWFKAQPAYFPFYLGMIGLYVLVNKVASLFNRQRH